MALGWFRRELRQQDYTQLVFDLSSARASGALTSRSSAAAGIVEACVSLISNTMSLSTVSPANSPDTRFVTPQFLATVTRAMLTAGQVVYILSVDRNGVRATQSSSFDISGGSRSRDLALSM